MNSCPHKKFHPNKCPPDREILADELRDAMLNIGLLHHGPTPPPGFTGLASAAPITWGYALADELLRLAEEEPEECDCTGGRRNTSAFHHPTCPKGIRLRAAGQ